MKKTKTGKCLAKKTKGITLIALVVTIVVLLILAAVSITTVFGDNGLLKMAKDAGDKTNEAVGKEQEGMANVSGILGEYTNGGGSGDTPTPTPSTTPEGKPLVETLIGKGVSDTNQEVQDKNGKPVVIPAGFTIVPAGTDSVEYADPTSPTVDDGIVIKDGVGNEFVWVPVPEINDMVRCKEHLDSKITFDETTKKFTCSEHENGEPTLVGKLYDFGTYDSLQKKFVAKNPPTPIEWNDWGEREPDTLSNFDDNSTYKGILGVESITEFKTQLQNEFNDLVKSVNKYKGFYIGRYETGNLQSGTVTKAVVQKERTDIANANWYCMYASSKNIAYKNASEKIESVTSSMIWGSQWDATLNWFLNSTDEDTKSYVTNSTGWYEGESGNDEHKTGINLNKDGKIVNKVKNIYDMAGNEYDWTIEAISTIHRVLRGGSCAPLYRF